MYAQMQMPMLLSLEAHCFADCHAVKLALLSLNRLEGSLKSVGRLIETNVLRTDAIHWYCGATTDLDRWRYVHMGPGTFGLHDGSGSVCCKGRDDPSKIGGIPAFLGPPCLQSRVQWPPLHLSRLPQRLG